MTHRLVLVFAILSATSVSGQSPEHYGLSGSLDYTRTSLALDSATTRGRNGVTVRLGIRVCTFCWVNYGDLTLTPSMAYSTTDFRGLSRNVHTYGFSRLDFGYQAAWRIKVIRPYVAFWQKNRRTAEVDRDLLNYVDLHPSHAWSYGIEIPRTHEGRGWDINVTSLSGRFREAEFRKDTIPVSLGYRGIAISFGRSGPLTGAGLFWR